MGSVDGKIGLAVIGCGRIAAAHFPGIRRTEQYELIAVADIQPERAMEAARQHNARRWYASIDEVTQDREVQAVMLFLPHDQHCTASVQCLESGKHVLVEKPMALSTAEADEMIAAASRAERVLMVAHVMRFMWARRRARSLIREGAIGRPVHAVERRLDMVGGLQTPWWASADQSGGLLWMLNGSHSVDALLWMLETEAERVYAEFRHSNPVWEGEDNFAVTLGLSNGACATLHQSWTSRVKAFDLLVIGDEGTIEVEGNTSVVLHGAGKAIREWSQAPVDPYEVQDREFASAILENREPEASGMDVRKVMTVLDAARVSASEKRVVEI